ncbi:hypothetical protein BN12_1920007 [Nostocoides japonicum T1-X7]|uniref:Uncharacterized protein n=1 Tax=Nostocoides japonicum T1-X7 TaxID=1194083 RepID=A0A077LZP5_9MICO|nr:hypothetical protein BN12_1920007 [Tetrasphaera japonica T1-X7]
MCVPLYEIVHIMKHRDPTGWPIPSASPGWNVLWDRRIQAIGRECGGLGASALLDPASLMRRVSLCPGVDGLPGSSALLHCLKSCWQISISETLDAALLTS